MMYFLNHLKKKRDLYQMMMKKTEKNLKSDILQHYRIMLSIRNPLQDFKCLSRSLNFQLILQIGSHL